jgi:homoprotocatechuate degradation regulator HpaR
MRKFSASLPMALLRARETVMAEFRPSLSAHGLSEQQWRVLRVLADIDGDITVGEVAERALLLGPSLSRILANLVERGLVVRQPDGRDARRAHLTITATGLALVRKIAPHSEAAYARIEGQFGHDSLQDLYRLLDTLAQLDHDSQAVDGATPLGDS